MWMNPIDYLILALVAGALLAAVLTIRKRKKGRNGCCGGGCGSCGLCDSCRSQDKAE